MGISERMKFNDIGIRKKLSQKKKKRIEYHKESKAIFSWIECTFHRD